MTDEEIRRQLTSAGFGNGEQDTFSTGGPYLPYTPPMQ